MKEEGAVPGRGLIAIGVFILATILGYLAILFGWIAYTELADVFDREGAMIMGIAFFFAPAGGLLIGLVASIVTFRRMSRRAAAEQQENLER